MTRKRFEKDILKILNKHTLTIYDGGREIEKNNEPIANDLLKLFFKRQEEICEYAKNIMMLKSKSNTNKETWFKKGQNSVKRRNKSGCCCMFNDDDTEIISLCGEHENYYEERIKK